MANPAYVSRIGSVVDTAPGTSDVITVGSAGVPAGATIIVSVGFGGGAGTGVTVADSKSNTYTLRVAQSDSGGGDYTFHFDSVNIGTALVSGDTITVSYGSASPTEVFFAADEGSGITAFDKGAGAGGSAQGYTSYSSGSTATTTAANELLWGIVGMQTAGSNPTWASGWTALAQLTNSTDLLSTAYRVVSATGAYAASGTMSATNAYMAIIGTYKGSTAPTFLAPPPYVANQAPQRAATW